MLLVIALAYYIYATWNDEDEGYCYWRDPQTLAEWEAENMISDEELEAEERTLQEEEKLLSSFQIINVKKPIKRKIR